MNFVKRHPKAASLDPAKKTKKKKVLKMVAIVSAVLFVFAGSLAAYLYATGSKIFQNGIGTNSILHAINGDVSNFAEERINILVMGRGGDGHPGGMLTDSNMVISIKTKEKKVALLSVPRDLYVPIKNHGSGKINSAFSDGYNDYMQKECKKKVQSSCQEAALAAGANLSKETFSSVLGIPIQYYVVVDFDGFTKIIDALGGVDINVETAIYDPTYPDKNMKGYEPLRIKAGQQHMNGDLALKYARSRHGSAGGDFDRAARQQKLLSAVKEKAVSAGILTSPKKLLDIFNIVSNHVRTSLSPDEIRALANIFQEVDSKSIISKVLTDAADGPLVSDSSTGTYYLKPRSGDYSVIKKIALNIFDLTLPKADMNLEISNGTTKSGLASTVAEKFKNKAGYEIVKVGNSSQPYASTVIYNYSGTEFSEELTNLAKIFNCSVVVKTKPAGTTADAAIIVGANYQNVTIN